jgi:hypothetical protein
MPTSLGASSRTWSSGDVNLTDSVLTAADICEMQILGARLNAARSGWLWGDPHPPNEAFHLVKGLVALGVPRTDQEMSRRVRHGPPGVAKPARKS